MNRSWISTGRRPNGLCGAAILISAKIHGFKRSTAQIVKAVHVCDETIRKRLGEFKSTNTAQLTRGELQKQEEIEKDPFKFQIEEKCYEPPPIVKRPIIKSLKMEPEGEQVLDDLRVMLLKKASKFDKIEEQEEAVELYQEPETQLVIVGNR